MEYLLYILLSMKDTIGGFRGIVTCLDKILRDTNQLLKGLSMYQIRLHLGIQLTLSECLDKLRELFDMQHSDIQNYACHTPKFPASSKCGSRRVDEYARKPETLERDRILNLAFNYTIKIDI